LGFRFRIGPIRLYKYISIYTSYILTIVIAERRWIGGRGHLRVVKIGDYKIAYGKRMRGVYNY
jgi:hypothetical protein